MNKKISHVKQKIDTYTIVSFVLLIVYLLFLIITNVWGVMTSLKTRSDYKLNPLGFPTEWKFDNYVLAFNSFKYQVRTATGSHDYFFGEMLLNSLLYSLGCTFFATIVPMCMAYVAAKFKFRFNKVITACVVVAMIVPIVGALPSEIRIAKAIGFYDNLVGVWLMKANFLGMYFLVFYANFKAIPDAYAESVYLDGGGNFSVFFDIMIPLSKTTIFVIAVLLFIGFWNDYQTPMVFLPSRPTAAFGLFVYQFANSSNQLSSVPMQMSGCFLLMLPILVVFMLMKDKMMGNLTVGGLKG